MRWNPRTTALWERAPVDASQENADELQALAEGDDLAITLRVKAISASPTIVVFVTWYSDSGTELDSSYVTAQTIHVDGGMGVYR